MPITNSLLWTTALLPALLPATPQDAPSVGSSPALVVIGEGEVVVAPDRAVLTLAATVQVPTAATAQQQVNEMMRGTVLAIQEAGVSDANIRTSSLTLHPIMRGQGRVQEDDDGSPPRIVAYRASNSIRVQVNDLSTLGTVIDAGVGAGANEIQGLVLAVADDELQRAEALRRAVQNARIKAEAIAQAAGLRLLGIERIEEGGVGPVPPIYARTEMATAGFDTPIELGRIRVSASVTLTYGIAAGAGEGAVGPH